MIKKYIDYLSINIVKRIHPSWTKLELDVRQLNRHSLLLETDLYILAVLSCFIETGSCMLKSLFQISTLARYACHTLNSSATLSSIFWSDSFSRATSSIFTSQSVSSAFSNPLFSQTSRSKSSIPSSPLKNKFHILCLLVHFFSIFAPLDVARYAKPSTKSLTKT